MAAVASQRVQQRKTPAVYGKAPRTAAPAANFFSDDEDELALPTPKPTRPVTVVQPIQKRAPKVKETQPITEPVAGHTPALVPQKKGALPSKAESPPEKKDAFDVPSSGDEAEDPLRYVPVAPKVRVGNGLVNDHTEETADSDPFNRKARKDANARRARLHVEDTQRAGSKTMQESAMTKLASTREQKRAGSRNLATTTAAQELTASVLETSPANLSGLSARDRLRMRARQTSARSSGDESAQVTTSLAKRSDVAQDATKQPQPKRRRMTPLESQLPRDVEMAEPPSSSRSTTVTPEGKRDRRDDDVFDVPADDEPELPITATARIAALGARKSRPQIPARSSKRNAAQQSVSAPEDLTRIVIKDTDLLVPDADVSTPARASTSQPSSTPSRKSPHGQTSAMTPKQTQTWAKYFEPASTPSADLERLDLSSNRRQAKTTIASQPKPVAANAPARRVRLVDRLKASVVNSNEAESSENDEDDVDVHEDAVMIDQPVKQAVVSHTSSQEPTKPRTMIRQSQSESQGHSQDRPLLIAETSSKVTYAKQRSYLAEGSLEDMMLDAPLDTPQRPAATARRTGKPAVAMKSNAFDLDGSDGGSGPSGLRTIHELRAGGRATRVMGEISDLMGEVADHDVTGRARRRGALLELGTKLLDKTFAAEQFVGHGFEQHLLAEIHAPSDAVADFLLASAFVLLLGAELPAHTAQCFAMALPWLTKLLSEPVDINKVVKDHRSNMSRSAQGDIVAFAVKVQALGGSLWGDLQPTALSSRLVAMKALDFLINTLRQQGDKSELLDSQHLHTILPMKGFTINASTPNAVIESDLSISILLALSTLFATNAWPQEVFAAISTLPALFGAESATQPIPQDSHTKWLAFRLASNLSNDPTLDPTLFSSKNAIIHLLREVAVGFERFSELTASQPGSQSTSSAEDEARRARKLDLLVLSLGILISLAEYSAPARAQAIEASSLPSLEAIIHYFIQGYGRAAEVESMEESSGNVAIGYTGVMLAGLCQDKNVKTVIARCLAKGKIESASGKEESAGLQVLITAVEEFVRHHQTLDAADAVRFDGEEGKTVWNSHTDMLVGVLAKLKSGNGS